MQVVAARFTPAYFPVGHHVHFWHLSASLDKYSPARHEFSVHEFCAVAIWYLPASQATHVPTPPISAPAVNTHSFSAPDTAGSPAVLAVAQSVLDAPAAAQLALVPPGLTAQVLPGLVKSTT